jgi:hypothetical protein
MVGHFMGLRVINGCLVGGLEHENASFGETVVIDGY